MDINEQARPDRIEVLPTAAGPGAAKIYADTAMAQLLNCHVQLINSERQTIWQRNAAMIVANSFMLTASNSRPWFCKFCCGIAPLRLVADHELAGLDIFSPADSVSQKTEMENGGRRYESAIPAPHR